jgi:hypothetical protein
MAAINDADVSVDSSGNIRWTGAATTNRHSVLEFIQWLQDKQDDDMAAGDDLLDITVDTAFDRSTDEILTLNAPFNIDDTFATHLYGGSVSQTEPVVGGETLYSGLGVIGPFEGGEYMILQAGKVLPAFWGTGINPEASPSLVFSRHLVKSRYAGADIDGQRITVLARTLGDQYRRFPVSLGTGSSVAAIGNGEDIFNGTPDTTIAGWTTILNTEGFQELDIDKTGAAGQEYYSQWDIGSQSINDTYERAKWITQNAHVADATGGTPTGADFIIDDNNTTSLGQAQSFEPLSGSEKITEVRANIKIGAGAPTGPLYVELWDSDDVAQPNARPTGSALARSEDILASAITSTYEEVIFRFNPLDPSDGSDQQSGLTLSNAEYFIVFRHPTGTASDYFHVEGASTNQDSAQNSAVESPASTWTASTNDIGITVKSSPAIHGIAGETFEGISLSVVYDGEVGAGLPEDTIAMWGTKITYDGLSGGPFYPGELVQFYVQSDTSTIRTGGTVLYDDGVDEIVVALDDLNVLVDNDEFSTVRGASEATATCTATFVDNDKAGGTGILLAKDDNGTTGDLYLQVITGVSPVDNSVIRASDTSGDPLADFCLANATITSRTLIPEFIGTSTGSNIIGAYGIGFDPNDVGSSDRFTSLDNAPRTPPNNVTFTVSGLVAGEDRVLVGPRTGSSLERNQFEVSTALTTATETSLVVKTGVETVPFVANTENWPDTGIGDDPTRLRILRADGIYARIPYDSHDSSSTFTLGTPSSGTINAEVSGVGGTGGQFDRISTGSFLSDGFERGCTFATTLFTNGGNNSTFTASAVYYGSTGTINMEVSGAGGSGQFDRISAGSFLVDGFVPNMVITTTGFTNGGNNGQFTISSVTATTIVVTDDTGMVNESSGGGNETAEGSTIVVDDDTGMVNESGGGGNETFTSSGWDFLTADSKNAAVDNNVFIAFIDVLADAATVSFTGVHDTANRDLFVRSRDGGATPVKTFESTSAQFLSTPQTVAIVRTADA